MSQRNISFLESHPQWCWQVGGASTLFCLAFPIKDGIFCEMIAGTNWTFCIYRPVSLSEANRGGQESEFEFYSH